MAGENTLWRYLRDGMRISRWHASRHEDRVTPGIPDVSFGIGGRNGWIELKRIPSWPARPTTPVDVGLVKEQEQWIVARGRVAGDVWIFLRVDLPREYLLFSWGAARSLVHKLRREAIRSLAWRRWRGRVDFGELANVLAFGCPNDREFWPGSCMQDERVIGRGKWPR